MELDNEEDEIQDECCAHEEAEEEEEEDEEIEEEEEEEEQKESEIPASVCFLTQTQKPRNQQYFLFQTKPSTPSANPTQLIQKLLPGHGPADGVTRQTLKSIRIQRPVVRLLPDSESKKAKTD